MPRYGSSLIHNQQYFDCQRYRVGFIKNMASQSEKSSILELAKALKAEHQDSSRVCDILFALEKVQVTRKILEATKIGRVVRNLQKRSTDKQVLDLCHSLLAKWKQEVKEAKVGKNSEQSAEVKAEVKADVKAEVKADVKAEVNLSKSGGILRVLQTEGSIPLYEDVKNVPSKVEKNRVQVLLKCTKGEVNPNRPVVYWMSRDQRVNDNWALLYAQEQAEKRGVPLCVVFSLVPKFLDASIRMYGFMLSGLADVEKGLRNKNIPFFLLKGSPQNTVSKFVQDHDACLLVTDMSPMRIGIAWREEVKGMIASSGVECGFHMVDAHNIVPVWVASPKLEYGARTIRSKINKVLGDYLTGFPSVKTQSVSIPASLVQSPPYDWDNIKENIEVDRSVPEVKWCIGGEIAARIHLNAFLGKRLRLYAKRNDPNVNGISNLSPWLHFGHIASQRCVLEASKYRKSHSEVVAAFIEEIVIRKELSDNFCHYNPDGYDKLGGMYPNFGNDSWAQISLRLHEGDKRSHVYSLKQFENGRTHEDLWNAAQLEMVHHGKMHGFMRMYWAKKILEWSESPERALEIAIYLNDKYSLDGRDPNGYVGCAWAIAGLHDQGWKERDVFGKIRYMNYDGCKRKFDVSLYVRNVQRLVAKVSSVKK